VCIYTLRACDASLNDDDNDDDDNDDDDDDDKESDVRAYQDAPGGRLPGNEFTSPVLGLRHPAHFAVRRPVARGPPAGNRLVRHGGGDRLLAEQPRQYPPREDKQETAEERDEARTEKRVPVRVAHAFLVG